MGLVPYGFIVKTHGLLGAVCLITYSRDFSNLEYIENIYVKEDSSNNFQRYKIISYSLSGKYAVLNLSKLDNIENAKHLKNKVIYINTNELYKTDVGEYYWFDLIGMFVYKSDGNLIGEVHNLLERSQQSLLVLRDKKNKEILIPLVNEIVKEIDLKNQKIIIDPPDGLLEIN